MPQSFRSFRDFERAGWSDRDVCAAYDDRMSSLTTQSVEPLLDAAGVSSGSRILDVATGAGYVAGAALARGAHPVGTDFSLEQLRLARRRHPAAPFAEGDADRLPFRSGSFDAVVCNYGVCHFPEPDAFFPEAYRVLRGGGTIAFAVWEMAGEAKVFGAIYGAIEACGTVDVGLPAGPNFFLFSDPAVCRRALQSAGFVECSVARIQQSWSAASPDDFFDTIMTGTVRAAAALKGQSPAALSAVRQHVRRALGGFRQGDQYVVPMPALLATAHRP